jgi:tRNA(Arg) A34 adenosine deaminase TadA
VAGIPVVMANSDMFKCAAIEECMKSSYKKRLGAVVVKKGLIVGVGHNKVHSTGNPREGRHAELEALNNTKARHRVNSVVYVCRLTKNDFLAMAKPCAACQTVMKKMGVKYVYFSVPGGWEKMILL